ncbi:DDE-type integrase/transposase/recombinase [Streptomyces sp. MMS20-AI2-20]|uniref:DDE-type integrase/transposase/recombinase n=1 Tax=Streptomyces sp. MMS20-AI2-20 TaxID=2925835 RepID=UPI0035B3BE87
MSKPPTGSPPLRPGRNGDEKYLWRAVEADGTVLGILVRNRRDKARGQALLQEADEGHPVDATSDRHRRAPFPRHRRPAATA